MCGTLRYLIVCLFLAKIIDNRNGMRGIFFWGLLLLSNIVYQSLDIFSVVSFSTKYSFSFSLYEFFLSVSIVLDKGNITNAVLTHFDFRFHSKYI